MEKKTPFLSSLNLLLALAVLVNMTLWATTMRQHAKWPNVPPPPTRAMAASAGFGDGQLAYRVLSLSLQQMGNEGGLSTPLYKYDYGRIGGWLEVLDFLDPVSNYAPYVAAYYFGATQNSAQLGPIIDYLARIGAYETGYKKWRWLSQAVYLSRFRQKDDKKAMDLAHALANLPGSIPPWARHMPAIISAGTGDKETARRLMGSIIVDLSQADDATLRSTSDEIRFNIDFLCNRLLTPEEARADRVCQVGQGMK